MARRVAPAVAGGRARNRSGLGLVEPGDSLRHRGYVEVVGGLLGVVVLLGHDAGLVESLGAIPIQLLLLQVGLGVLHIGFGGFFRGNIGGNVGLGGGDGGLLAGNRWPPAARSRWWPPVSPFFTWSPSFT